jgi:hypothetical protein
MENAVSHDDVYNFEQSETHIFSLNLPDHPLARIRLATSTWSRFLTKYCGYDGSLLSTSNSQFHSHSHTQSQSQKNVSNSIATDLKNHLLRSRICKSESTLLTHPEVLIQCRLAKLLFSHSDVDYALLETWGNKSTPEHIDSIERHPNSNFNSFLLKSLTYHEFPEILILILSLPKYSANSSINLSTLTTQMNASNHSDFTATAAAAQQMLFVAAWILHIPIPFHNFAQTLMFCTFPFYVWDLLRLQHLPDGRPYPLVHLCQPTAVYWSFTARQQLLTPQSMVQGCNPTLLQRLYESHDSNRASRTYLQANKPAVFILSFVHLIASNISCIRCINVTKTKPELHVLFALNLVFDCEYIPKINCGLKLYSYELVAPRACGIHCTYISASKLITGNCLCSYRACLAKHVKNPIRIAGLHVKLYIALRAVPKLRE